MSHAHLFSPIEIRALQLKNRVVFPAMGTFYTDDGGYVNDQFINYHVARALGGTALNTTEACSVHRPSAPRNFLNISDDCFLPGLRRFTDAIHNAGGKVCVQLWQGGATTVIFDPQTVPVIPSEITIDAVFGNQIGQEIRLPSAAKEMIEEVVYAFGAAAARAAHAGFDTVEFHLAHGYSPHAFLSPGFNHRTDEYGGSFENRARFPLACIRAIRENIPDDMPLFMRIDAHDDLVEDGLTLENVIEFCKLAKDAGVDVVNVSRGNPLSFAMKYEVPPIDLPRGFNVENAAAIREATGLVTMAVGRINEPNQADRIIADGKADLVAMGRAQLADPEFCNKAQAGNDEEIVLCVACNQGCTASPLTCTRNPMLGREKDAHLVPADHKKKVLVIGGGMGGLEAAIVSKQRGHDVVLLEESSRLGGQFYVAGLAPRKGEMRDAAISRGHQAEKLGIAIHLETPATASQLDSIRPDTVVIAGGAHPMSLRIPGADLPNVVDFLDVLEGRIIPRGNVVVIGGGLVGLEVAEYVAETVPDATVTILEMQEQIAKDLPVARQMCVTESLEEKKINVLVNATCVEIVEAAVVVEVSGKIQEIPGDTVVMAIGSVSNDFSEVERYCDLNNVPYSIIGDAKKPRKVIDAIAEAAELARRI